MIGAHVESCLVRLGHRITESELGRSLGQVVEMDGLCLYSS